MMLPYTIEEHSHRLAAWAASRAASVNRCRFKVIQGVEILEACGFSADFSLRRLPVTPDDLDIAHRKWREAIICAANERGLSFTHGVAAKLINCYMKVRFVCGGNHEQESVKILHPPLDELLLSELARRDFGGQAKAWRSFRDARWSKFDSNTYEQAIALLQQSLPAGEPLWKIEEYWAGHQ